MSVSTNQKVIYPDSDAQPELLRLTFRPPSYPSNQVFTASDLNLYYDVHVLRTSRSS